MLLWYDENFICYFVVEVEIRDRRIRKGERKSTWKRHSFKNDKKVFLHLLFHQARVIKPVLPHRIVLRHRLGKRLKLLGELENIRYVLSSLPVLAQSDVSVLLSQKASYLQVFMLSGAVLAEPFLIILLSECNTLVKWGKETYGWMEAVSPGALPASSLQCHFEKWVGPVIGTLSTCLYWDACEAYTSGILTFMGFIQGPAPNFESTLSY